MLSQLALRSYDANMTLGRTKAVDILVSDPATGRMFKLEVKTNYRTTRAKPKVSKLHGVTVSEWMMHRKHEELLDPELFYCFVNIGKSTNVFRFYLVPSAVVARYVREEHALWLRKGGAGGRAVKENDIRIFRIGLRGERYAIRTLRTDL